MLSRHYCSLMLTLLCVGSSVLSADEPDAAAPKITHRITGLFCPERVDDFRDLCARKLARFQLASIDYDKAEATFAYDPAKEFPGAKPEQVIERFNNELRQASRSTFGAKPASQIAREKLTLVEFTIVGLDCKACSLAVYEILERQPGVEQATASFKERKATALIDPEKTDRAKLETALKDRGVTLTPPTPPQ